MINFPLWFRKLMYILEFLYIQIMEIREAVEEAPDSQALNQIQSKVW